MKYTELRRQISCHGELTGFKGSNYSIKIIKLSNNISYKEFSGREANEIYKNINNL